MRAPIDDRSGDADRREECVGSAVVTHGYATPVLEPTEHNLDAPVRPVELLVVGDSNSVDLGGMQGVMPFAASAFRNSSLS